MRLTTRTAAGWLLAISVTLCAAAGTTAYKVMKRVKLGGEGGWDYLTIDAAARRLYIARSNRVIVVDADSYHSIAEIPDTPGVHGVALAPELGRGFTSNGAESTVSIFDLKDLHVTGKAKVGNTPDAILYDPASRRVFTFNARGKDTTAIDAVTGTVVGSVPLGGKPEFAVSDNSGRVYVNIEDTSELVALDTRKLAVLSRWPLKPCIDPTGLALDKTRHRLFAGCRNELMAVVNADTGNVIIMLPIGAGVDGTAFDGDRHLAFSSNGGSGTITVVREDADDKYSVIQNVETARGARTLALDAKTHNLYTVTAERTVPGSFELLVVGSE